jgi:cellulose synthase/poly-beta-1,6-N-acetylglucosamine synthase-like glycosyltransferase
MNNSLYIFLIPASNPDQKLIEIVNALKKYAYQIIIIDDGSRLETLHIFQELKDNVNNENIVFLKHAINLGKGAALKTAFNWPFFSASRTCKQLATGCCPSLSSVTTPLTFGKLTKI